MISQQDAFGKKKIKNGSGKWLSEFPFGTVQGRQIKGKRVGLWTIKYANGEVLIKEQYDFGKLVGGAKPSINKTLFYGYIPNTYIEKLNNHNATSLDYPEIVSLPKQLKGSTEEVFTIVEQMPRPVNKYTYQNQIRPKLNVKEKPKLTKKGKVFIQFKVDKLGNVYDVETIKGIGTLYDNVAEEIILKTKWIPGYQKGKPVNVKLVRNIIFDVD